MKVKISKNIEILKPQTAYITPPRAGPVSNTILRENSTRELACNNSSLLTRLGRREFLAGEKNVVNIASRVPAR
jgi:hypothetical protein